MSKFSSVRLSFSLHCVFQKQHSSLSTCTQRLTFSRNWPPALPLPGDTPLGAALYPRPLAISSPASCLGHETPRGLDGPHSQLQAVIQCSASTRGPEGNAEKAASSSASDTGNGHLCPHSRAQWVLGCFPWQAHTPPQGGPGTGGQFQAWVRSSTHPELQAWASSGLVPPAPRWTCVSRCDSHLRWSKELRGWGNLWDS